MPSSPQEIEAARYRVLRNYHIFAGFQDSPYLTLSSLLDMHPDTIVAHNVAYQDVILEGVDRVPFFKSLLEDARAQVRREDVPEGFVKIKQKGLWHGMQRFIYTVGSATQVGSAGARFSGNPDLLDKLRETVQVPLRVIHIIHNPFDSVAQMSLKGFRPLEECGRRYGTNAKNNMKLREMLAGDEWLDLRYEMLVARPKDMMTKLCGFLQIEPTPEFLDVCEQNLLKASTRPRDQVFWDPVAQFRVRSVIDEMPFLTGYTFDK